MLIENIAAQVHAYLCISVDGFMKPYVNHMSLHVVFYILNNGYAHVVLDMTKSLRDLCVLIGRVEFQANPTTIIVCGARSAHNRAT